MVVTVGSSCFQLRFVHSLLFILLSSFVIVRPVLRGYNPVCKVTPVILHRVVFPETFPARPTKWTTLQGYFAHKKSPPPRTLQ